MKREGGGEPCNQPSDHHASKPHREGGRKGDTGTRGCGHVRGRGMERRHTTKGTHVHTPTHTCTCKHIHLHIPTISTHVHVLLQIDMSTCTPVINEVVITVDVHVDNVMGSITSTATSSPFMSHSLIHSFQ